MATGISMPSGVFFCHFFPVRFFSAIFPGFLKETCGNRRDAAWEQKQRRNCHLFVGMAKRHEPLKVMTPGEFSCETSSPDPRDRAVPTVVLVVF